jgi:hypothetical protein
VFAFTEPRLLVSLLFPQQDALNEARSLEDEFEETRVELREQVAEAEARYWSARAELAVLEKQSSDQGIADDGAITALALSLGGGTVTVVFGLLFTALLSADGDYGPWTYVALVAPLSLLASAALLSFVRVRWAEPVGLSSTKKIEKSLLDAKNDSCEFRQPGPVAYAQGAGLGTTAALGLIYRDLWLSLWCGVWVCAALSPPSDDDTDESSVDEKRFKISESPKLDTTNKDQAPDKEFFGASGARAGALHVAIVASLGLGLRDCAFWTIAALAMLVPASSKRAFRDEAYSLVLRSAKSVVMR